MVSFLLFQFFSNNDCRGKNSQESQSSNNLNPWVNNLSFFDMDPISYFYVFPQICLVYGENIHIQSLTNGSFQSNVSNQNFYHFQPQDPKQSIFQKSDGTFLRETKNQHDAQFQENNDELRKISQKQTREKNNQKDQQIFRNNKQPIQKFERKPTKQFAFKKTNLKSKKKKKIITKSQKQSKCQTNLQKNRNQHWKRTIMPSLYQNIFSFIGRKQRSESLIMKLFQKNKKPNNSNSRNCNLTRFYQYQALLKQKLFYTPNNKKFSLIRVLHDPSAVNFNTQQQIYYNKVSRVGIKLFVENELLAWILEKNRTSLHDETDEIRKRQSYEIYLKMYRQIRKTMYQAFSN